MLSILIPTKGRPEKLEQCVKSIDVQCRIMILATKEEDIPYAVRRDPRAVWIINPNLSVIEAQILMAQLSLGDIIPISDDITFDAGSISKAESVLYDPQVGLCGDGVVGFKVRNMECKDYAYCLVGRKFLSQTLRGKLYHDGYKHFFADQELGDVAKRERKFRVAHDATIFNYHPIAGFPEDATHTDGRGEKLAHDEQVYRSRILHG